MARERWGLEAWREYQAERIASLLQISSACVPYYRKEWSALGITAQEISRDPLGTFARVPVLEKNALRAAPESFLREGLSPKSLTICHTSGSTGTPIKTYWNNKEFRRSLALRESRSTAWAGVSFSMPRATFSGRIVVPNAESRGPFHRYNLAERQVYFSAFHLTRANASIYAEAMRHHGTEWLTGYAVSSALLARQMIEEGLKPLSLKAVITTSEKLTERMRGDMRAAYGCRAYEEYGTVEDAVFASECEDGSLHVSPDACLMEILRPDGSPASPGETGEVITTCLLRDCQPLIRYRVGDLARWSPRGCSCGRAMPVLEEVVGRIEDVVYGPDCRQMVRFHGIFTDQPHVVEAQVIQEALDKLRILVVVTPDFGKVDIEGITMRVRQRLTDKMRVEVVPVPRLERNPAGKFKAVVSLLSSEVIESLRRGASAF